MDTLLEEHRKLVLLLLKNNVEFMIVGGYAVVYYGYARATVDMDIWLKPDNNNRDKLIKTLREYGIIEEDLKNIENIDFKSTLVFHIGEEPYKTDFLTKISGVSYEEADKEKVFFSVDKEKVPVIEFYHLIRSKITTERPRDKTDVEELQKIAKLRKKL